MSTPDPLSAEADDPFADLLPADPDDGTEVELGRFEKRAGQVIVMKLVFLNAAWRFDARVYFFDVGGELKPTKQGLMLSLEKLEHLEAAFARARYLAGIVKPAA